MPTASQLHSIHLLRALLREASYLPDANARTYFHRYILNRFRTYQPPQKNAPRRASLIAQRARPLQRKAQKALNHLRRANLGDMRCLEKILLFTYGRLGPRKYALQQYLLTPTTNCTADGTAAPLQKLYYSNDRCLAFFNAPYRKDNNNYKIDFSDRYPRLKAMVMSQHTQDISMVRSLKKPSLVTPILNAWHRPMPIRRAKNNVKKYYAGIMSVLLPPLPPAEWDALYAKTQGQGQIELVPRRKPAFQRHPEPLDEQSALAAVIDAALALKKPSKAEKDTSSKGPHNITAKFMRRMYARLFPFCSKIEFDSARNKWIVTWGKPQDLHTQSLFQSPVPKELFAGVDEHGCKPRAPNKAQGDGDHRGVKLRNGKYVPIPFYFDLLPKDHPRRIQVEQALRERDQS
ncbi:unnamed protein product [Periconia digitata]|uniref:LYR motif-containing protein Cup1-like N-terminal domain-containing protein n=1 Tax=Periconia digitata TaxID=1303443 RepID=A0A9W4U7S4_9PLEO|nr:unnamed protein product [Periconia digitata]